MLDQTQIKRLIQAAEQAWYACPHQTRLIRGCPNTKGMFSVFDRMFDGLNILSNAIKHGHSVGLACTHHITYCTIALSATVVKSLMTYWYLSSPIKYPSYYPDDIFKAQQKISVISDSHQTWTVGPPSGEFCQVS